MNNDEMTFDEAARGLLNGDFSRLAPLFEIDPGGSCPIIDWYEDGSFAREPAALEEAFTCACFNGCTEVIEYLLARDVNPSGGARTGLNAFHWAANRGQLSTVELLIRSGAPLEAQNAYGGTVLGCAVYSTIHEPKPDHLRIVQTLLQAGARVDAAEHPSGDERIDTVLRRYAASEP